MKWIRKVEGIRDIPGTTCLKNQEGVGCKAYKELFDSYFFFFQLCAAFTLGNNIDSGKDKNP
jgi:hypothetical protein